MDNPQQPDVGSDEGLVFQLEVSMGIYHLTAVRRFVAELMQSVVNDAALAARLAMATHELLENAVKYSDWFRCGWQQSTVTVFGSRSRMRLQKS
jgi:anti-sigma regulatory factor (Ser/Thr protein kinase)